MEINYTLQINNNGFEYRKRNNLSLNAFNVSLIVFLLSIFSCKKDDSTGGTSGICPQVVAVSPDSLEKNVSIHTTISVTFNEEMDANTFNASTFTVKRGTTPVPVAGIISYSNKVAVFKLAENLNPHDTYTATVTTGVKDLAGTALSNDYQWVFYTSSLPWLGNATRLAVLGGNSGITNNGTNTAIYNAGIGTTATSNNVTGFHDTITGDVYSENALNIGKVAGRIYAGLPAPGSFSSFLTAAYSLIDATEAYNTIAPATQVYGTDLPAGGEIGGMTYTPGVYKALSSGISVTAGDLVLDAKGDANATWIFQTTFNLNIGSITPKNVVLLNGAVAKNVYWYVGGTATINQAGGGVVNGVILAYNGINISGIANTQQTILNGRALCINGPVNMFNTTITAQ